MKEVLYDSTFVPGAPLTTVNTFTMVIFFWELPVTDCFNRSAVALKLGVEWHEDMILPIGRDGSLLEVFICPVGAAGG